MAKLLSDRATVSSDWEDFSFKFVSVCNSNPYDETNNSSGYINLGTAVNNICDDILHLKLSDVWTCDFDSLEYKEGRGTLRLRKAIAKMMTEYLESHKPISPDDLFCLTGVTSCIDLLGHCLAEPGDVFLVHTPMYPRIHTDFMQRSLIKLLPIQLVTEDDNDEYPVLTLEKLVSAYQSAILNHEVRGIILMNPNNLSGNIYSPELLIDIISFCSDNSLHVIVDEVYALSVFSKTEKFHSILKFSHRFDPDRTHVLHGISKGFGVAGLSVGVIHTKCEQLQQSLKQLSHFQCIPHPVMDIAARFLEDLEWWNTYITSYQERLAENYEYCVDYFKKIGVKIRECSTGFFVWVDFRHLCGTSFEDERRLFNFLLNRFCLYIGPGEEFFRVQPGWFRIVFAQNMNHLKAGLDRLKEALEEYKPSK